MRNKTKTLACRVGDDLYDLTIKVCSYRGEDVSDFIRRSVRKELAELSFYPDHVKKALGVFTSNPQGGVQNNG